ncbi:MAG: rod shape-determining protein MreD [Actinomycetota bacterium]
MIWKRTLLLFLLTVTGLALETSVFGTATLVGTKPELLLLMTVALAMGEGPAVGATAGFVMGLSTDLVLQLPAGVTALTYTLIGYVVGRLRARITTPSAWLPIAIVCLATFTGVLFYAGFNYILGESLMPVRVIRAAGFATIYNGLLTPFIFPIVRALGARLRPRPPEILR